MPFPPWSCMQTSCSPRLEQQTEISTAMAPASDIPMLFLMAPQSLNGKQSFGQTCHCAESLCALDEYAITHSPSADSPDPGRKGAAVTSLWQVWLACWPKPVFNFSVPSNLHEGSWWECQQDVARPAHQVSVVLLASSPALCCPLRPGEDTGEPLSHYAPT